MKGFLLVGLLWVLQPFTCHASDLERAFWEWFRKNEPTLFEVVTAQEPICDSLMMYLHSLHPSLTFEFGPVLYGEREFVISADLDINAFPHVEALYATAIYLPRWKWRKFSPRRAPLDINLNSISVKAQSVKAHVYKGATPGRTDVQLIIPSYRQEQQADFEMIAWLLLRDALGEYDVVTKVGRVALASHSSSEGIQAVFDLSLTDFPGFFDAFHSSPRH